MDEGPNFQLKTSRGVLFLPSSDAYVRSFLYLLYSLIKLYYTKALSNQALSLAPDWILLRRPSLFVQQQPFIGVKLTLTTLLRSVQLLNHVWLFVTPWTAARQASLSFTNSKNLLKSMSIQSVMPSSHLILCCPLLPLPSIFPSIRVFLMSLLFTSGGQTIGVSVVASVLSVNIQDCFLLELNGLISLQYNGFSKVFSNTTVEKRQFFGTQPSLWSNSHLHTWLLENS